MIRNMQIDRYHKLKLTSNSMTPAQWHLYVPPDIKFISLHFLFYVFLIITGTNIHYFLMQY